MKKVFFLVSLCLAFSLVFVVNASAGSTMESILKKGELVIGTTGTQPPMSATSKKGEIFGMDIDLSRGIADALGVKLRIVTMPFTELLSSLDAGNIDMVLSGMTINAKRNKQAAFVGPYMVTGKGILAVAERFAHLKKATGLDSPEVTVAALKDSTSQEFVETSISKAKLIKLDSYDEGIDLLLKGKVDVIVADFQLCALTAYRHRTKGLIAGESPLSFEPLGIAMPEDTLLINWMQNFLNQLLGTGEMEKLTDKWLNIGSWIDELP